MRHFWGQSACLVSLMAIAMCAGVLSAHAAPHGSSTPSKAKHGVGGVSDAAAPQKALPGSVYDYALPSAEGKDIPLSTFRGKYILLVNLARESSYNSQLAALQHLSQTYKDRGVVVVGVPSNDFGSCEPGSDADIQKFYAQVRPGLLITAVSKLTGDDAMPLYAYLAKGSGNVPAEPVHWNYTKFIIDPQGQVVARLDPDVAPDSPEMIATLEQILGGRYKPTKPAEKMPLNIAVAGQN